MKKRTVKKIVAIILALTTLMSFTMPMFAIDVLPFEQGVITSDNSNVDLSGIEVEIYYAEHVPNEYNMDIYGENYSHSVFTDENGRFSFGKPTENYSYSVALNSLPYGCGIKSFSKFVSDGEEIDPLVVSEIISTDLYLNNSNLCADFYDVNGESLYADYEIVLDNAEDLVLNTSSVKAKYSEIDNIKNIEVQGKVVASQKQIPFEEEFDVSECSISDKVELLYSLGAISKMEKNRFDIEIAEQEYKEDLICGTMTCDFGYEIDRTEIKTNFIGTQQSSVNRIPPETPYMEEVQVQDNYYIDIYYYEGFSSDYLKYVKSYAIEIFRAFCWDYFDKRPQTYESNGKIIYEIYVVENSSDTEAKGQTVPDGVSGASHIRLYENAFIGDLVPFRVKEAIAHELTHAIMIAYGIHNEGRYNWHHESTAYVLSLKYIEDSFKYNRDISASDHEKQAQNHLKHTNSSIYSPYEKGEIMTYNAFLLMLCIYEKYGGYSAFKTIFENFSNAEGDTVTNKFLNAIDITYDGQNYKYIDIFAWMALYNYDCYFFYKHPPIHREDWLLKDEEKQIYRMTITDIECKSDTLEPMSYKHVTYVNSTGTPAKTKVRVRAAENNDSIAVMCMATIDMGYRLPTTILNGYHGVTIRYDDLGASRNIEAILVPINKYLQGGKNVTFYAETEYFD